MRNLLKEESQLLEELRSKVEVAARENPDDSISSDTRDHHEVKERSESNLGKAKSNNKAGDAKDTNPEAEGKGGSVRAMYPSVRERTFLCVRVTLVNPDDFNIKKSPVVEGVLTFGSKHTKSLKTTQTYVTILTKLGPDVIEVKILKDLSDSLSSVEIEDGKQVNEETRTTRNFGRD
uniref:C2 NT-type domain-containing protein n=1 Tax=Syphacia muris TaxID=451379 RepID=A0A0N5ABL6_9BILA